MKNFIFCAVKLWIIAVRIFKTPEYNDYIIDTSFHRFRSIHFQVIASFAENHFHGKNEYKILN